MRRVPWMMAVQLNGRVALTVAGCTLAVAYALTSFAIAEGLERDSLGIARNHPTETLILVRADGAPFLPEELAGVPGVIGVATGEGIDDRGRPIVVAALVGDEVVTAPPGAAVAQMPDAPVRSVKVGSRTLPVASYQRDPLIPPSWFLVELSAVSDDGRVLYGALRAPSDVQLSAARASGFEIVEAPALQSFFRATGGELSRDLLLVAIFSSVLAALFCYELLRSDVFEMQHQIGVLRALGMRAGDVTLLFLGRAAFAGILSLALGWWVSAFGIHLVYASASAPPSFRWDALDALAISIAFVAAALAGGWLPSRTAGRITVDAALRSQG